MNTVATARHLTVSMIVLYMLATVTSLLTIVKADSACSDFSKEPYISADPDDCAGYFICYRGHSIRLTCDSKLGPQTVFDPKSGNCVLRGSPYDNSKCKLPLKLIFIFSICLGDFQKLYWH